MVEIARDLLGLGVDVIFVLRREVRAKAGLDKVEQLAQHAQMVAAVVCAEEIFAVDFGEVEPMVRIHLAGSTERATLVRRDAVGRHNLAVGDRVDALGDGLGHGPKFEKVGHSVDVGCRSSALAMGPRIRVVRLVAAAVLRVGCHTTFKLVKLFLGR